MAPLQQEHSSLNSTFILFYLSSIHLYINKFTCMTIHVNIGIILNKRIMHVNIQNDTKWVVPCQIYLRGICRQHRPRIEIINFVSCLIQLSMKFGLLKIPNYKQLQMLFLLNITEHEHFSAYKYENANYFSGENFMLSSVEHEKSFINSAQE